MTQGYLLTDTLSEGPLFLSRDRIAAFAETSGDASNVHLDDRVAQEFGFPQALAHGLLGAALAHRLICRHFPQHSIRRVSTRFVAMTFADDVLRCEARITELGGTDSATELTITALNQNDEVVMTGDASIALES